MRSDDAKLKTNRQELRRAARREPVDRCPVCGKRSNRHNRTVHDRAGVPVPSSD